MRKRNGLRGESAQRASRRRALAARGAWMAFLALVGAASGASEVQPVVTAFSAGPPSGAHALASRTPKTLPELLQGQGTPTTIAGHLYLPAGEDQVPAVVFMHGSGGPYDAMRDFWPRHFNARGYAMLALDTFGPRGVKSTVEDQSQIPFAADVADVYAALRAMASHPRIEGSQIALLGVSRGGLATWRAALQKVIDAQPAGARYAAFIPMYSGGCVGGMRVVVKPGVFGQAPMLWIHGDADDYAPMGACKDYAERIGAAGTPVSFEVLPGAAHKFDRESQRRTVLPRAQTTRAGCPLEFDMQTFAHHDRTTGQKLTPEAVREIRHTACASLGASVEGHRSARDRAAARIDRFLLDTFGR